MLFFTKNTIDTSLTLSMDVALILATFVGFLPTKHEASAAYFQRIPVVSVRGSGGTADEIADSYLDDRRLIRVEGETSPVKAVKRAIQMSGLASGT